MRCNISHGLGAAAEALGRYARAVPSPRFQSLHPSCSAPLLSLGAADSPRWPHARRAAPPAWVPCVDAGGGGAARKA